MIRFLSCVDSKVTFEGLQVPEACAADLAGVRLLPSVNEHVSTEVGHLERAALGEDSPRDEGIPPGAWASHQEWGSAQPSFFGLLGSRWESEPHVSEVCYLQSLTASGGEELKPAIRLPTKPNWPTRTLRPLFIPQHHGKSCPRQ